MRDAHADEVALLKDGAHVDFVLSCAPPLMHIHHTTHIRLSKVPDPDNWTCAKAAKRRVSAERQDARQGKPAQYLRATRQIH